MEYTEAGAEVPRAGPDFAPLMGRMLSIIVSTSSANGNAPKRPYFTRFHGVTAPKISVSDYIQRLSTYFLCSDECFVLALEYLNRFTRMRPHVALSTMSIHRLVLTTLVLAVKFFDDAYYTNAYYARVGGVQLQEMNALELDFLNRIGWALHVTPEDYARRRAEIFRTRDIFSRLSGVVTENCRKFSDIDYCHPDDDESHALCVSR